METIKNPSGSVKRKRRIRAHRDGVLGHLAVFKTIYVWAVDRVTGMTSLANRIYLERYLKRATAKSEANDEVVVLAFLDIKGVKYLKDFSGRDLGAKMLNALARSLRERCREGDLVARHGWDDFVIVFVAPTMYRTEVVERIKEIVRSAFDHTLKSFERNKISVSMGISVYPRPAPSVSLLLQTADQSRNCVKREGELFSVCEYRDEAEAG